MIKKEMIKLLSGILLLIFCFSVSKAEEPDRKYSKWSVGANMSGSNFLGTLNMTNKSLINHFDEDLNFSFGLNANRKINELISLEGEWMNGKLSGIWNDPKVPQENPITYNTDINQFTLSGLFNLNNLFSSKKFDRQWYVYGKAGLGVAFLDGRYDQTVQNNRSFVVPIGLGVNIKVSKTIDLALASTMTIGNDWINSSQEWIASGNTYRELYLNTGIVLSYRFSTKKRKVIPAEIVTIEVIQTEEENPEEQTVDTKNTSEAKIHLIVEPEHEIEEEEIKVKVNKSSRIEIQESWKIVNGYVWGELPLEGVVYRVQVLDNSIQSASEEDTSIDQNVEEPVVASSEKVHYKSPDENAKSFRTYEAAKAYSDKLKDRGIFLNTIIVAFKNGIQIK